MTIMDLLTIPLSGQTSNLQQLRKESFERMKKAATSEAILIERANERFKREYRK